MSMTSPVRLVPVPDPEPEPFEVLYRDQYDFVRRCARRLGVTPAAVDDVVQDVFIVAYRRRGVFDGSCRVQTWLFGILRNLARNHRRSLFRRARRHQALEQDYWSRPCDDRTFDRLLAVRLLDRFLARLDDNKRAVFVMAEIEGMSAREISASLGINSNTASSRLRAGRKCFVRTFGGRGQMYRECRQLGIRDPRGLLQAARKEFPSTREERDRTWALVGLKLTVPGVAATAGGGSALAGSGAVGLFSAKWASGLVVVGALVATATLTPAADPAAPGASAARDMAPSNQTTPGGGSRPAIRPAGLRAETPAEPPAELAAEPGPELGRPPPAGPARPPTTTTARHPTPRPDDSLEFLGLVDRARTRLVAGDSSEALRLLNQRTPDPAQPVWKQHTLTKVGAYCRLGRADEAHALARTFVARFPASAHAELMRHPCSPATQRPNEVRRMRK